MCVTEPDIQQAENAKARLEKCQEKMQAAKARDIP